MDSRYQPKSGYNDERIASAYIAKLQQYDCAVLEVDEDNIDDVLQRALRGIKSYIDEYKNKSGIQLFHDGFFRPRYHGQLGLRRARFYERVLENNDLDIQEKALALYALMACNNGGSSLREAVSKSVHQMNRTLFNTQLVRYLTVNASWDDLAPRFKHYQQHGNGLSKDSSLTVTALG